MQDLYGPPQCRENYETQNEVQPNCQFADLDWLQSSVDPQKNGQRQAFAEPGSYLPYWGEQPNLEASSQQGMIQGDVPNGLWNIKTHSVDDYLLNVPHSPRRTKMHGGFTSQALLPLSIPSSEPHPFPLSPPSSTWGGVASPLCQAVNTQQGVTNAAPQVGLDPSASLLSGPSMPERKFTMPPTPQPFSPKMTWSNEDFAKILESDPFWANSDWLDNGAAEQSLLGAAFQDQGVSTSRDPIQSYTQNQQEDWRDLLLSQPICSNTYPLHSDVLDQDNVFNSPTSVMPNINFDVVSESSRPEVSKQTPSLFDCLSPDIDRRKMGRRIVARANECANAKDRALIEWKNQGLSYKEIKARGGFDEAESTLRGRYRTLTKPKHLRVRKPEWQQRDVQWPNIHTEHG